jgi:hypothetical protein
MTKTDKKIHNFIISVLLSILVWNIVNKYVIPLTLMDFIYIEIIIGISEIFSNFVKEKMGLLTPDVDPKSKE